LFVFILDDLIVDKGGSFAILWKITGLCCVETLLRSIPKELRATYDNIKRHFREFTLMENYSKITLLNYDRFCDKEHIDGEWL